LVILLVGLVSAAETVGTLESTVCCEKTKSGLACLDVPESECSTESGIRQLPTSCESSSFCDPGYCADPVEGTCLDNVPQIVCQESGGSWYDDKPPQCNLGCCVLGDQAAFVTLVRCKKLAASFGIETSWNGGILDELICVLSVAAEEKGACVFEEDYEKTCKFVKRSECDESLLGGGIVAPVEEEVGDGDLVAVPDSGGEEGEEDGGSVEEEEEDGENEEEEGDGESGEEDEPALSPGIEFYAGKLCTAPDLLTNCGMTKETICLPGKEEVYFVDTCGNPANIYDKSRVTDQNYWSDVIDSKDSCNPNSANENSKVCGNCNYLLGSYCREDTEGVNPSHGDNVCASLNCEDAEGKKRLHGESWCGYDEEDFDFLPEENPVGDMIGDALEMEISNKLSEVVSSAVSNRVGSRVGQVFGNKFLSSAGGSVGSRFHRYICINGEVKIEPCADFRQEQCIENVIDTVAGPFSEAACRVNRWQDCTAQRNLQDCENNDQRDCTWLAGVEYILMGAVLNGSDISNNNLGSVKEAAGAEIAREGGLGNMPRGGCVPEVPPGLNFWTGEESTTVCQQASAVCPVTYTKGIGGDWECEDNCFCDPEENPGVVAQRAQVCMAMGDCGPKVNIVGEKGRGIGYKFEMQELDDD